MGYVGKIVDPQSIVWQAMSMAGFPIWVHSLCIMEQGLKIKQGLNFHSTIFKPYCHWLSTVGDQGKII